jgi:hypothetical protein
MKKKLFSLNFKQVLIIVTPLAVVALFVIIAFTQLMGLIINESIKSSMGFVCEKVEYETNNDDLNKVKELLSKIEEGAKNEKTCYNSKSIKREESRRRSAGEGACACGQ